MKIYTRKGDQGETSLMGGTRISKAELRIEAYGTVDELNSCLGLVRDHAQNQVENPLLERIQNQLFTIGSNLAAEPGRELPLPQMEKGAAAALEEAMDALDAQLTPLRNFILPGGDRTASFCHLARCVARRAERRVVALAGQEEVDPELIRYLNRLSDYLFVLARFYTHTHGGTETPWKTNI